MDGAHLAALEHVPYLLVCALEELVAEEDQLHEALE